MSKFTPLYVVLAIVGIASAFVPQIPYLNGVVAALPLVLAFFFFAVTQRQSVERARLGGLRLLTSTALLVCGIAALGSSVDIAQKGLYFLAMVIFAMAFGRSSNFKNERPYLAENLGILLLVPFLFLGMHAMLIRTLGFVNFPVMACEVGCIVIIFAALNRKYNVKDASFNTVLQGTFLLVLSFIVYAFKNYSFINSEDYQSYFVYFEAGYFLCYALGLYLITRGILMQIDAELPDEDEITFLDVEQKTGF